MAKQPPVSEDCDRESRQAAYVAKDEWANDSKYRPDRNLQGARVAIEEKRAITINDFDQRNVFCRAIWRP